VCEIVKRRFLPDVKIKGIDIGTQQLPAREGEEGRGPSNVSTIEITLAK
jgi:DNA-binding protein Alba